MICVGCGDKIKGEPYWVDRNPFCSEECAALGVDDQIEDYIDDAEYLEDAEEEYEDFEDDFKKDFQDEYEEYN